MRNSVTYRSWRRNEWRKGTPNGIVPWPIYNGAAPKFQLGTSKSAGHITFRGRSKYMPHESVKRGGAGPVYAP